MTDTVHVVVEVTYGNEGSPDVYVFRNQADAEAKKKELEDENRELEKQAGLEPSDWLVIYEEVPLK